MADNFQLAPIETPITMKLHSMLCFGRHDGSGNAAIVVEDLALTESDRLGFAQRQDAGATVFVETDATGSTLLDFYYPHMRSPLCLHATLAASAVFFARYPDSRRTQFVTSMRRQVLEVARTDHGIFIDVRPQLCPTLSTNVTEVAQFLNIEAINLIGQPRLASVGSAKLLVEVADQSVLDALRPDLAAISDWGRKNGVAGLYVYCRLHDV